MTAHDHARIAEAIRAAEGTTAGEIYCVVARSSDSYFVPAALVALVSMLIASLGLEIWWFSIRLPFFVAAQLLAFAGVLALLAIRPKLALRLAPRRLQFSRAHDNAVKQFLARNVHITTERTGVLIFVSIAERYAEIIADSGIDRHVEQRLWDDIVADLIEHARTCRRLRPLDRGRGKPARRLRAQAGRRPQRARGSSGRTLDQNGSNRPQPVCISAQGTNIRVLPSPVARVYG
jgi:putative membrane protein